MNLADAIRKASHLPLTAPVVEHPQVQEPAEPMMASPFEFEPEETNMNDNTDQSQGEVIGQQQTAVRLELLLTPDQLSNLFRAVAANQHTLWTVRDAASYLRISGHSLESMADKGEIPGFKVDGRWRFAKATIDEWLKYSQTTKEAA
ncbi:MAG: helix-turn-helix domain-containing protein [Fimbriimonadaceae bacterium]